MFVSVLDLAWAPCPLASASAPAPGSRSRSLLKPGHASASGPVPRPLAAGAGPGPRPRALGPHTFPEASSQEDEGASLKKVCQECLTEAENKNYVHVNDKLKPSLEYWLRPRQLVFFSVELVSFSFFLVSFSVF